MRISVETPQSDYSIHCFLIELEFGNVNFHVFSVFIRLYILLYPE